MREYKKISALLLLIFSFWVSGCVDSSSNVNSPSAQSFNQTASLSGVITKTAEPRSLRTGVVSEPVAGAEVWLAELPEYKSTTDSNGVYSIEDIPAGTYHVIGKFLASGAVFKTRSAASAVAPGDNKKGDLELIPALNIVKGTIKDGAGNVLPVGTELWFWGEKFFVEDNGRFQMPPIPDLKAEELVQELLVNRGRASEFRVPVSLGPKVNTILEITAPLDSTSVASFPTIVIVATDKSGNVIDTATGEEEVTLTATFQPAGANVKWIALSPSYYYPMPNDTEPEEFPAHYFNAVSDANRFHTVSSEETSQVRLWKAPNTTGFYRIIVSITNAAGRNATAAVILKTLTSYVRVSGTLKNAVTGGPVSSGKAEFVFRGHRISDSRPADLSAGFDVPKSADATSVLIRVDGYSEKTISLQSLQSDTDLGEVMLQPEHYTVIGCWEDVPEWVKEEVLLVDVLAYSCGKVVSRTTSSLTSQSFELRGIPKGISVKVTAEIKGYKMVNPLEIIPDRDFAGIINQAISLKRHYTPIMSGSIRLIVSGNAISPGDVVSGYCEQTGTRWPDTVVAPPDDYTVGAPMSVDLGWQQFPYGYAFTIQAQIKEKGIAVSKKVTAVGQLLELQFD